MPNLESAVSHQVITHMISVRQRLGPYQVGSTVNDIPAYDTHYNLNCVLLTDQNWLRQGRLLVWTLSHFLTKDGSSGGRLLVPWTALHVGIVQRHTDVCVRAGHFSKTKVIVINMYHRSQAD